MQDPWWLSGRPEVFYPFTGMLVRSDTFVLVPSALPFP